jgi:phage shock protein PspC (stress-responsive transcriptional regulator)
MTMKKTISITIKSMHFLVEEDAYDLLSIYLARVETILEQTSGKKEIIEDIELRIAELCQQKCTPKKEVIDIEDMRSILNTLGNPDEFIETDEASYSGSTTSQTESAPEKRLFRNPEQGMIAGVCSGIAAYFGIDVVVIRALFLLVFLTVGFGMPLYIILWVIVPKANSSIDKLRMQGKPITFENVKEEVEQASERIKSTTSKWHDRVKRAQNDTNLFVRAARFFLKFIGYVIISLGISLFIALVIFFFNQNNLVPIEFNGHQLTLTELNSLVFDNPKDTSWAYLGISLSLICLMFFLLISGSSLVFNLKNKLLKYVGWVTFSVGLIGIVICTAIGIKTANSFREEVEIERPAHTYSGDTLSITTRSLGIYSVKNEKMAIEEEQSLTVSGANATIHGIEITYQQSPDSLFRIFHHVSAKGNSTKEAVQRIKRISYTSSLNGNELILPTYFTFPKRDHLRDQEVKIIVKIPKGNVIKLDGKQLVFEATNFEDGTIIGGGSFDPAGNYSGW